MSNSVLNGNFSLDALNEFYDLDVAEIATLAFQIAGTFNMTLTWTGSNDGTNFVSIITAQGALASTTSAGIRWLNVVGLNKVRFTVTAFTSGQMDISYNGQRESLTAGLIPTNASAFVPGTAASSLGKAEDALHASGDTGVMSLGVMNLTGTSTVSGDGDYTYIATDNVGSLRMIAGFKQTVSGAHTQHRLISAASGNATNVKASPGNLYKAIISNSNAAVRYVKFYNSASAPTAGVGTPTLVIAVPPTNTVHIDFAMTPLGFSAGIGYTTVTGPTDADAVSVAAADILMTLEYA